MNQLFSRKYLISFFYLIVCVVGNSAVSAQNKDEETLSDYPEVFELERIIQLPVQELVATVSSMSVFEDSLILLTDGMSQQVFWLNSETNQIKQLNPEDCHPGFEYLPIHSFFRNDGSIFLMNSGNIRGYRFQKNGECEGSVYEKYTASASTFITPFNADKMVRLEIPPHDIEHPIVEVLDRMGKVESLIEINLGLPFLAFRYTGGGIASTGDGNVYVTEPGSNRIIDIDTKTGKQSASSLFEPDYISPFPAKDLDKTSDPQKMFSYFNELFKKYSVVNSMHALNDRILIQQVGFLEDGIRKTAILLYDRKTKRFSADKIIIKEGFLFAANNKLYMINTVEDEESDELTNPSISVFRYIEPEEF